MSSENQHGRKNASVRIYRCVHECTGGECAMQIVVKELLVLLRGKYYVKQILHLAGRRCCQKVAIKQNFFMGATTKKD